MYPVTMTATLLALATGCAVGLTGVEVANPGLAAPWTARVDPDRMMADVQHLAAFGTRHTLSETESETRGIGAARRWLKAQMDACKSPTLTTRLEEFKVRKGVRVPNGAVVVNVVGVLPGTRPEAAQRAYYVVGHYDSRNSDPMDFKGDSPGANDDASGTSVVIELLRALADKPLESTIVFLCTAGEEQGLLGAKAHAETVAATKPYVVCGVLSNDIVGDCLVRPGEKGEKAWPAGVVTSPELRVLAEGPDPTRTVRVFSDGVPRNASAERLAKICNLAAENDSASRQLARFVAYVADREQSDVLPMLVFRPDRFLRGGDHASFNEAGFPAVRFTTLNEDYTRQHQDVVDRDGIKYGDVVSYVNKDYLAKVARLNLATLVHLANAPSVPGRVRIITAALDHNTILRWEKSPETDTAGYEIVWRGTTDWQWRTVLDVGTKTEVLLPINKDNVFFGVRAYDSDGYRSPVGFAEDAKE